MKKQVNKNRCQFRFAKQTTVKLSWLNLLNLLQGFKTTLVSNVIKPCYKILTNMNIEANQATFMMIGTNPAV